MENTLQTHAFSINFNAPWLHDDRQRPFRFRGCQLEFPHNR